jgi:hypothetical protein
VGVLDDVHEVGALEAGYESVQDIRIDVAERGVRLGRVAVGERLQDAALEVRPRVQGGDLGPAAVCP